MMKGLLQNRLPVMAMTGMRIMFYDPLKLAGTLFGVIFAVVLSNQ